MTAVLDLDSAADVADAGAFLSRVVRLDPAALVRLRQAAVAVQLWSALPLDVLVTRHVAGRMQSADVTVAAADLLASLDSQSQSVVLPPARDSLWRGALPGTSGWHRLDSVPAAEVLALVEAGAEAFRAAAVADDPGRVGEALLDHESLVVSNPQTSVAVPMRVLQALARMGFVPAGGQVAFAVNDAWLRCDAAYGSAYRRRGDGLSLFTL
ncbi:MAG: hypothetical protein WCB04_10165 [Mycobacteriales bacterium]